MTLTSLILLLVFACGDKDDTAGDGGGTDGGGTDGGADGGGTDGGTDGGATDGGSERLGALIFQGEATVHTSYMGSERLVFKADSGSGEVLCQLLYGIEGATPRTDCDECDWAFDVVVGPVQVEADVDGACEAIGYGQAARDAMAGSTRGYGYIAEYFGHAPVLVVDDGGWNPVSYASYDETSGLLAYDWQDATLPY